MSDFQFYLIMLSLHIILGEIYRDRFLSILFKMSAFGYSLAIIKGFFWP